MKGFPAKDTAERSMTATIFKQLMAIRATGETNMFDIPMVERLAFDQGFYELVTYIKESHGRYAHFIMTGREEE